ncbi:MAG TPA: heparinase II/III family protein [Planctomycetota bacterium]|nr:heparinase II/III family protein [Planctomycetota bacterium]HRT95914.1 heparinase II/III family protein [Planctomycetota bacterium]
MNPVAILGIMIVAASAEDWRVPPIALPKTLKHPVIAATPEELSRLRAALKAAGPAHDAVAGVVRQADAALANPIAFPPRGGQHNQWYQCDKCQLALKTLDDTHHECPRCKTVYSGEPYDDVVYEHQHYANIRNASNAAWAYALTGEKRYADFAAKVLLGYAERYLQYPYHSASRSPSPWTIISGGRLFEQTLNEAASLASDIAPACDLIWDALSDADRAAIRDGLLIPMLKNMDKHKAGKGNWQTWHNAGMIAGGAVLGDLAWVEKAIAQPHNGFVEQMKVSVSDEGMWYENSWGYHFYTLHAMTLIAEYARRLGIDLWSHPTLRKMYTLPVHYTMPDGSLPRWGDDVHASARGAGWLMEYAYAATKDPDLLPLLAQSPTWQSVMLARDPSTKAEPPLLTSKVFPSAGHAILRTKGEAGLAAALTFGPYGGYHGHLDKLSFVLFGHREELGVDPGRAASQAYRLPIHRNWYKPTLSHNAVLVDKQPQRPAEGKLELFTANDEYAAVAASCDTAYPGVTHKRLLVLTPTYLLILDQLASDKPRRFDWVYHNRATAIECDAAKEPGKAPDGFLGMEYVQNIRAGATDGSIRAQFPGKTVTTHLTMAAAPGAEVLVGDGPCASVLDRVPMIAVTQQGASAMFAAVIEPVLSGRKPGVTTVELAGTVVTVRRGDSVDQATLSPANGLTVAVGGSAVLVRPE